MKSGEEGYVVVYALLVFLLCTAAISGIVICYKGWSEGGFLTLAISASLSALLLLWGWRRNRDAFLIFCGAMLSVSAVVSFIATLSLYSFNDSWSLPWLAVSLVLTVAAVALVSFLIRRKRRPEDPRFPNILKHEFGAEAILERDGIQIVSAVQTEESPAILLILQNCWSAERQVRLKFDTGNLRMTMPNTLLSTRDIGIPLGPAEVVRVIVPVRPDGKPFKVFVDVRVTGAGGRRVRLWESQPISMRMTPVWGLLMLSLGHLVWGGGIKVSFPALPPVGVGSEPNTTVLWRPHPGDLLYEPR